MSRSRFKKCTILMGTQKDDFPDINFIRPRYSSAGKTSFWSRPCSSLYSFWLANVDARNHDANLSNGQHSTSTTSDRFWHLLWFRPTRLKHNPAGSRQFHGHNGYRRYFQHNCFYIYWPVSAGSFFRLEEDRHQTVKRDLGAQ